MKIAVISALPAGLNTGMLTVEYAFKSLVDTQKKWKVDRYCFEKPFHLDYENFGEISVAEIQSSDVLKKYDKIIFWGDFLHWRGYLNKDLYFRSQKKDPQKDLQEIADKYYDVFFLEKNRELISRVVSFGGTVYPLSQDDFQDNRYEENFLSLIRDARYVKFRDVYSSNLASGLLTSDKNFMGMDPAFFLNTEKISPHQHARPYMVFSFGRSGQNELLKSVAIRIAKSLGLDAYDLQWFALQNNKNPLIKKLEILRGSAIVLTDIYHMAVNAFRENKPTYMFGNGASYAMSSLSDKKKEILFKQYLQEPQYIYTELIKNEKYLSSVIDAMNMKLRNKKINYDYLNHQIQYLRNQLIQVIDKK